MYKVILVDDEIPALRYLQAVFEKYAQEFHIAALCHNAEEALAYLAHDDADLLLTDISMPGMDGITLAQQVRRTHPDMRIVIVSGYAEFEYAQGAIQAAVDDYILKPVSISHMTTTLDKIKAHLDNASADQTPALLKAMLTGAPVDKVLLQRLFGSGNYLFALVRWGNLTSVHEEELRSTAIVPSPNVPFHVLTGRCREEQLLYVRQETNSMDFYAAVKAYVAQHTDCATWTIVFSRSAAPFETFPLFVRRAQKLLRNSVVIGRRHFLYLQPTQKDNAPPRIPNNSLRMLEHLQENGNKKLIKDMFITLATDWENRQMPQIHAYHMVQQLLHTLMPTLVAQSISQDEMMHSILELFTYASSYSELMVELYTLLLDNNLSKDKKHSPEELYTLALDYIHEKYVEPISISSVCSEIGISQTYLSRLFRKYGKTSFQVFLTNLRIDKGKALMRAHPDMRLRDVAACVGYDDPSYFSKVFRQKTGLTPTQWSEQPDIP